MKARLPLGLLVALAVATSRAAVCPDPPPCPPPEDTTCTTESDTTFTFSTTTCYGETPSETQTITETFGGENVTICIGEQRAEGFRVCPGTVNYDTLTETVLDAGRIFSDVIEPGPPT